LCEGKNIILEGMGDNFTFGTVHIKALNFNSFPIIVKILVEQITQNWTVLLRKVLIAAYRFSKGFSKSPDDL
jgi:hypothetical protein